MIKVIFSSIVLNSSFAFSNTITCDAISGSQINKVQISYTSTQIETIDLIKAETATTERIYSRTYSDPSIRGGYVVSYCNPDDNEITEHSGMSAYSSCKVANSSDDVQFSFRLNKDHTDGKVSITYLSLSSGILKSELTLRSCN